MNEFSYPGGFSPDMIFPLELSSSPRHIDYVESFSLDPFSIGNLSAISSDGVPESQSPSESSKLERIGDLFENELESDGEILNCGAKRRKIIERNDSGDVIRSRSVWVCPEPGCNKTFNSCSKYSRHRRVHSGDRPFVCNWPNCGSAYTRRDHLNRHLATHTGDRKFKCSHPGCSHAFADSTHLKRHMKYHEKSSPFKCTYAGCEKGFSKAHLLKQHTYEHTGILPFSCDECQERFLTLRQLNVHSKKRHCIEFVCALSINNTECGKVFASKADLRAHHLHAHHSVFFPCTMPGCEVICESEDELNRHLCADHNSFDQNLVCPFDGCGMVFKSLNALDVHYERTHLNVQKFQCEVPSCDKTFKTKVALIKHMKSMHERPEKKVISSSEGKQKSGPKQKSLSATIAGLTYQEARFLLQ